MTKKFDNQKKDKFINAIPSETIETSDLIIRSKINFSYLDVNQKESGNFSDMKNEKLLELMEKFQSYSKESLEHWSEQKIGNGGKNVFEIYETSPEYSAFTHPKHVPAGVKWCRFRVDREFRLIGFVIPDELHGKKDEKTGLVYDKNTFYLVFLDPEHNFCK